MEVLTRIGRNQVLGTLFLLLGSVLLSYYDPRLEILVPSLGSTPTDLLTRILVLVSGGFFAGFLFENALDTVGNRVARALCEKTRSSRGRDTLRTQESDLDAVLVGEPFMSASLKGKPAMTRFLAVARYLSQERYKDFPELSPLRAFEDAIAYSTASLVFVGLGIVGVASSVANNGLYANESRLLVVGLSWLLAGLLFFNARGRYEEGRQSTLISMREKRSDAERAAKAELERQRAASEEQQKAKAEVETLMKQASEFGREIAAIHDDVASGSLSKRHVGVTNLAGLIARSRPVLDYAGPHREDFLRVIRLATGLYQSGDVAALNDFLRPALSVIMQTDAVDLYDAMEKELTPPIFQIIEHESYDYAAFVIAAQVAQNLRSPELAGAVINRAAKEHSQIGVQNLLLNQLGSVALGQFNRGLLMSAFQTIPVFAQDSALRNVTTNILNGLNQPEAIRGNLPKVLQKVRLPT